MRHAILQSLVNELIIAITNSAAILWVLWRHTDGLDIILLIQEHSIREQSKVSLISKVSFV